MTRNRPGNFPPPRSKVRSHSTGDGISNRVLILGAVAFVSAALLLIQYSRKKRMADVRRNRELIAAETMTIQSESREAERGESAPTFFKSEAAVVEKTQDEAAIAKQMSLLEARSGLGIVNQPYFVDAAGKRVIRVLIEAQPRCGVGDYEAIEGDFQRNKFTALLVSLESVKSDGGPLVHDAKSVSLASIYAGTTIQMAAPDRSSPIPASLYVCTDIGPRNCSSKSLVAVGSLLLTRYNTPDAAADGSGKIYYQNYVELGEQGVGFSSDIDPRADGFAGQFADYGRKLAAFSDDAPDRAFQKFADHGRVLYSESLKTEDGGVVVINLPRDDRSICPKVQ